MTERQRIARDDNDQHEQHRHHPARYLFNAVLHAVVDDERGNAHEQQREHHRRHRRGDERGEVIVRRSSARLTGDVNDRIFCDPAADDRVVRHDEHGHEEGQDAQTLPLRAHLLIRADRALLRAAADGDVRCQQREAERQYQNKVDDEEQTAAVLGRQIRETPQISHTDRASGCGKDKPQLSRKVILLFFHCEIFLLTPKFLYS